jgi:hypothetical protein
MVDHVQYHPQIHELHYMCTFRSLSMSTTICDEFTVHRSQNRCHLHKDAKPLTSGPHTEAATVLGKADEPCVDRHMASELPCCQSRSSIRR